MLNEGGQVDAIGLDMSRAFDKVPRGKLLEKLQLLSVPAYLVSFVSGYLQDRKQRTVIDGFPSAPANVTSGVPQGSIIGPLLFLAFVNDMPIVV